MPRINPCLVANSGKGWGQGKSLGVVRPAGEAEDTARLFSLLGREESRGPFPTEIDKSGQSPTA